MPRNRLVGVIAVLIATALAIAGVRLLDRGSDGADGAPPAQATIVLNATDDAFLQLMIPIDESALVFLTEAQTLTRSPALRALAAELVGTHQAELTEMRALLARGGTAEQNIHEGHRMPGMIFDDQQAELRSTPEAERDGQAIALLRGHLEQCEVLANGEETAGGTDETRSFAVRLKQVRTEQLAKLSAIARTPSY
ncbi:DUF305 domain-containing protein [Asanoa sp. NPDC049518]|uniref:DUF305 domain-containing protein n=1 Tax=unclassified Asanoa TaxID=2685164 RepID=UPI0034331458